MTKVGAFCSPHVHLKKSTSILVNGALVLEKIEFEFFCKCAKNRQKIRYCEQKTSLPLSG